MQLLFILLCIALLGLNYSQITLCDKTAFGTIELLYWLTRSIIIIYITTNIVKKYSKDTEFQMTGVKMLLGSYIFLFEIYTIIIPYYKLFKDGMIKDPKRTKTDPDVLLKRYIDRFINRKNSKQSGKKTVSRSSKK